MLHLKLLKLKTFLTPAFAWEKPKPDYLYAMHQRALFVLFFLPVLIFGQPAVQWRKSIKNGVQSANSASAIAMDKWGNTFIAGTTNETDSAKKILLVKLDTAGTEQWRRVFREGNRDAVSIAAAVDGQGNVLLCGTVKNESENTDLVTLKYSPDGILLWQDIYAGKANLFDVPTGLVVDKKNNVYVCGYETDAEANPDLLLIRYHASGTRSFVRNYATPKMDIGVDAVVDDSCQVYVCGTIDAGTRSADMIVMKFDSAGNSKWNYVYNGSDNSVDVATDMAMDDSTNIFITGSANRANDKADVPVIRLNRNGRLICEKLISEGVADGSGSRLAVSGKTVLVQAVFTDYLQQTVTQSVHAADRSCRLKSRLTPDSADVTYLEAASWNRHSIILFGSILSRPENTIAPYIETMDSLFNTQTVFRDEVLISLLRIKDVLLHGRDVYFLGDDATEHAGTISVAKYSFPPEPKKKPKVPNQKPK